MPNLIKKIIAGTFILIGISFMTVIKLFEIFGGDGFVFGSVLAFAGCYMLMDFKDKINQGGKNENTK